MITKIQIRTALYSVLLLFLVNSSNFSYALDANNQGATTVSMHEIARQIRQYTNWQILDASPRKRESGLPYFRFKLLRSNGKVKIINIDPRNPNFRHLE